MSLLIDDELARYDDIDTGTLRRRFDIVMRLAAAQFQKAIENSYDQKNLNGMCAALSLLNRTLDTPLPTEKELLVAAAQRLEPDIILRAKQHREKAKAIAVLVQDSISEEAENLESPEDRNIRRMAIKTRDKMNNRAAELEQALKVIRKLYIEGPHEPER